jgi:hypothetical protein
MTEREFMLIWAVLAVAMGTSLIASPKSAVRSALRWQLQNPDAPHPQWLYPFMRGIGWLFVVVGVGMGGSEIAKLFS